MADASTAVIRPAVVHQHLAGVEGVENLPATGPCVLVPNHSSFADHLVLVAILPALRDRGTYYLTKAEAFGHSLRRKWTEGMGGIPVDRERPGRELLTAVDSVFASGSTLVVYPEGTRGPGWPLLPFKDGAFWFAQRAGVPVIPVGLLGTQDILPKGAVLPRRAKARVVFGPPLEVDASLPRAKRVAAMTEQGREAVAALIENAREPAPGRDREAARQLAARATAALETMLSRTDELPAKERIRQIRALLRLTRLSDPDNPDAQLVQARLLGLRALEAPLPLRPAMMRGVRTRAERVMEQDPEHLMARYLLGRWHLMTPRLLGGRPEEGLAHLRMAAQRGGPDTRYAMAYAEGLLALGSEPEAATVFRGIADTPAADPRTEHRRQRAAAEYAALAANGTTPHMGGERNHEQLTHTVVR